MPKIISYYLTTPDHVIYYPVSISQLISQYASRQYLASGPHLIIQTLRIIWLITSYTLLITRYYNGLNNVQPCIVIGFRLFKCSELLSEITPINSLFNMEENVFINAVKPLDEVWHSLTSFVRGSHLLNCVFCRSCVRTLWTTWSYPSGPWSN